MDRRNFLKNFAIQVSALAVAPSILGDGITASNVPNMTFASAPYNPLPRWRGFNFLDFFTQHNRSHNPTACRKETPKEYLEWMRDWGFDFVRIPMAYPSYLKYDQRRAQRYITPEEVLIYDEAALERVDKFIETAHSLGLHTSLNIHRAPGFCINAGFHEPYNLWKDKEAQDAFYAHWAMWAERYKSISPEKLSFDLLNEPCAPEDMNNQLTKKPPIDGNIYRKVVKGCLDAILVHNPQRFIVADGNGCGHLVTPELVDLGVAQSCRGYTPMEISHYGASWVYKNPDDLPKIEWPGVIKGKTYNRQTLMDFYKPWIDLLNKGIGVHCGEFGCYNRTPHKIFLAWFEDLLSIFKEMGIGWGLWEFSGDFGVLDSGRADVDYEDWYGHKLDRKMLELLKKY